MRQMGGNSFESGEMIQEVEPQFRLGTEWLDKKFRVPRSNRVGRKSFFPKGCLKVEQIVLELLFVFEKFWEPGKIFELETGIIF